MGIKRKVLYHSCIRGLFDTDGSVFFQKRNIKIEISSGIPSLRKSIEKAMSLLDFKKKWTKSHGSVRRYGLYSKADVNRFINIIGFNNPKHKRKIASMV